METVNEALELLRRQAEIEQAMKDAGGIRISEEQAELATCLRQTAALHCGK